MPSLLNLYHVRIPFAGGVEYIRWGKTTCPCTDGTETIYAGQAGGSNWARGGGGVNYLCLPYNTDNTMPVVPGFQVQRSGVFGTEYETRHFDPSKTEPEIPHFSDLHDSDVPCVACYTTQRSTKIMIPGRTSCTDSSWTKEYHGYLMSGVGRHASRRTYECVDAEAESIGGTGANENGALFYLTEAHCGSLGCPPYKDGEELSCVVCTK